MQIAVVGAGITGLFAACLLESRGHCVEVFEKRSGDLEADYGVCLSSSALLTLLRSTAVWPGAINWLQTFMSFAVCQQRSRCFRQLKGGKWEVEEELIRPEEVAPHFIRRQVLLRLMQEQLITTSLNKGCELKQLQTENDEVRLEFQNGKRWRGDLLLACDGVYSSVACLAGIQRRINSLGHRYWRGITYNAKGIMNGEFRRYETNGQLRLTMFDLGTSAGTTKATHWCLFAPLQTELSESDLNNQALEGLPAEIVNMIRGTPDHTITGGQVLDIDPQQTITGERIAFIGDAAHAMAPTQARGISSGLEDALTLAESIERKDSVKAILESYTRKRLSTVRKEQQVSRLEYKRKIWTERTNPDPERFSNEPIQEN